MKYDHILIRLLGELHYSNELKSAEDLDVNIDEYNSAIKYALDQHFIDGVIALGGGWGPRKYQTKDMIVLKAGVEYLKEQEYKPID